MKYFMKLRFFNRQPTEKELLMTLFEITESHTAAIAALDSRLAAAEAKLSAVDTAPVGSGSIADIASLRTDLNILTALVGTPTPAA